MGGHTGSFSVHFFDPLSMYKLHFFSLLGFHLPLLFISCISHCSVLFFTFVSPLCILYFSSDPSQYFCVPPHPPFLSVCLSLSAFSKLNSRVNPCSFRPPEKKRAQKGKDSSLFGISIKM